MEDIQGHKDFTRSKPGDVSAFLCNFLKGSCIKPKQVLRAAGLPTTDLHDDFALQALYEAASPYMPATVVSDTDSDAQSEDYDSEFFCYLFFCGKRTGIAFMIFLSLYVFLRFLTWRARHSQPLFTTRLCFLFCNQLASARLVIRRAVEIESPRFVSCSWFIGLIGLDTELPDKSIST